MLVIGRRPGQSITIETPEGKVVISFVPYKNAFRFAIEAPRSIRVYRTEAEQYKNPKIGCPDDL